MTGAASMRPSLWLWMHGCRHGVCGGATLSTVARRVRRAGTIARLSTTTRSGDETFPWHSLPVTGGPVNHSYLDRIKNYIAIEFLEGLSAPALSQDEFREASCFAFCQAVRAIFGGDAKLPIGQDVAQTEPPPLEDMMEGMLSWTLKTRAKMLRDAGKTMRLEIETIDSVDVAWTDLVIAPKPTSPLKNVYRRYKWLFLTVVGRERTPAERKKWWYKPNFVAAPSGHVCRQVAVDIVCKERFVVRHAGTGRILQGHDDVEEVRHRVVFQQSLGTLGNNDKSSDQAERGKEKPWMVVDIDELFGGYGHQFCAPTADVQQQGINAHTHHHQQQQQQQRHDHHDKQP